MMKINRLRFDSELCGREVGKCITEKSLDKTDEDFIRELKKYDLVYLTTKFEKNITHFLKNLDWILADIKIRLSQNIRHIQYINTELSQDDFCDQEDCNRLIELVMDLPETCRFYFDENVRNLGRKIYQEWIKNSINKSVADEIVVCRDDEGQVIGFITIKIDGVVAEPVLVKVDRACVGKGYGKSLMNKFLSYVAQKKPDIVINVYTQLRNLMALKYYQSFGLKVKGYQFVYNVYPNGFMNI